MTSKIFIQCNQMKTKAFHEERDAKLAMETKSIN